MAKDIKLLIAGNVKRAEAAMRELQRTGHDVSNRLERDFAQLGTQSTTAFENKRDAATKAYERIKKSGTATADELLRAERGLAERLKTIDQEQYGQRLTLAEKFRKNWVGITAAAAAGGFAIYSTAESSIREFQDFQTALVDLGKVTDESLDQVREKIMALPPELGSATELVQGYYQTISAGVTDPKEAMDLLVTASKASKAAHVEQSETIKALTKLMAGFSGEIGSAAEASDLLFAIEAKGQTTFQEMVPVIGNVASLSHQVAVSQYEMGAAMAELTQTSGSTSDAATKYSAILRGLIKPTGDMEDALADLGFESGKAAVEQRGLAGVLLDLDEYARKSGIGMGKLFESSEALTGLGPLLADQFSGYNESLQAMNENAGGTEKAFGDWKGTFEAVKQAFDNSLGKVLIELGQELAPKVIAAMQSVTDWIQTNRGEIMSFIDGLGQAIGLATTLIGHLYTAVELTAKVMGDLAAEASLGASSANYQAERETRLNPSAGLGRVVNQPQDPNAPFGSYSPGYAVGTAYVPATGIYRLHRGEEVRTRGEARRDSGHTITVAPTFNITATQSGNPQQTARELARLIYPELQAIGPRFRTR